MSSAREKQVRRALAAERSRQKRTTDAELAAYRRWIRRAIPWVIALNAAMIVLLIWQGIYGAIAANLTVMPMLWLCWWLIRIAEARDAAPPPPAGPKVGPWADPDFDITDHVGGLPAPALRPPDVQARWPHPLDNPPRRG